MSLAPEFCSIDRLEWAKRVPVLQPSLVRVLQRDGHNALPLIGTHKLVSTFTLCWHMLTSNPSQQGLNTP